MAVEEHGVKLVADISDFKRKMKEAQNTANSMGKKLQDSFKMDKGLFEDNEIIRRYVQMDNNISKLSVNFDKLSQNMTLTKTSVMGVSNNLAKVSDESRKVEVNTKGVFKAFDKGLKSVKRLTIGFLGARSAFMLFRKYLGEYQSQNEVFANKMQLTTNVLVNSLAPAFEFFGNVIQYAVIGLAKIIELLTGVNILAKTVDNGFKGASKSAKEFNDNLSGLDEISNIDQSASGLSTGLQSQINALDEFQKKIKEVEDWFAKTGIKKFLQDLAPIVKDVFGWIVDHPLGTLGLLGAFMGIKAILPALLGGASTGLIGVAAVLGTIAAIGIIKVGIDFINTKNQIDENINSWEKLAEKMGYLKSQTEEFVNKLSDGNIEEVFNTMSGFAQNNAEHLKNSSEEIRKNREEMGLLEYTINAGLGYFRDEDEMLKTIADHMLYNVSVMKEMESQGKLSEEQEKQYINTLIETRNALEKAGLKGADYQQALSDIDAELSKLKDKNVTATVEVDANFSKAEKKSQGWFQTLLYSANNIIKAITNPVGFLTSAFKETGGIFAGSWQPITAYAGGGLPDTGQMFVAREAGPEMVGTIGGHTAVINNDQIVASVSAGVYEAVLSAMGGQSDKPIILNVNGKEFAKATYGDYQEEGSRRGANTSIRRV